MKQLIKNKILDKDENYIILYNGEIIDHSKKVNSLVFDQDIKLKLIHIIDKNTVINIIVKENVNVKIEEIFFDVTNNPELLINVYTNKNSKLDLLSFITSKDSSISAIVNTYISESSYINNKSLFVVSQKANYQTNVYLKEKDASIDLKNVFINNSSCLQEFETNIHHIGRTTLSTMNSYGISKNNSILNIKSDGIIKKGAIKTELKQKAKGLILDSNSIISADPWLEIDEHDCLASHGASIGAIDEDELYYLMSRGLTKLEAEKMIVSGFINPLFNEIKEGKFQDYLISYLNKNF